MMPAANPSRRLLVLVAIVLLAGGPVPESQAGRLGLAASEAAVSGEPLLAKLRAERRAAMRAQMDRAAKAAVPGRSCLLVIPVDFADERLPGGKAPDSLAARLFSDSGQSLARYFRAASNGRLELQITLAPLVHLAGERSDYSDIGWNGFTRTRALARESITAARDLGIDFAGLDGDGPDGLVASGDDDGQVDGVLILHAGIGQENDVEEGVVQALQFFLAEPVHADGVAASFYAVASLRSGPGIWAHETGHLLGLEDRYDLLLAPDGASEVMSRGGLGRFSLMASGAWGTGGGWHPALLDAYSLIQMGWAEPVVPIQSGEYSVEPAGTGGSPLKVWPGGAAGPEYFLLETRDPVASFPFDQALWRDQLLILHVDEDLAEGSSGFDLAGERYIRVSVVEADGDRLLRDGIHDGGLQDLFPGETGATDLTDSGYPSTYGHDAPTFILISDIRPQDGGMALGLGFQDSPGLDLRFGYLEESSAFRLEVLSFGVPFSDFACTISVAGDPTWGSFEGGASVTVELVPDGTGAYSPVGPISWIPEGDPPAGASTEFRFEFTEGGTYVTRKARVWRWSTPPESLDFSSTWPEEWSQDWPTGEGDTRWHLWDGAAIPGSGSESILACTGNDFADGASWPLVTYANSTSAYLLSPVIGEDVVGVRLRHACEFERRDAALLMDGGRLRWRGPDRSILPVEPVGGWPALISAQSLNPLQGQGSFRGDTLSFREDELVWQVDAVAVPQAGTGPWRLEFQFGANSRFRRAGWFVAELELLTASDPVRGFAAAWAGTGADPDRLDWTWPWPDELPSSWWLQAWDPIAADWTDVREYATGEAGPAEPGVHTLGLGDIRAALSSFAPPAGSSIRIMARAAGAWVATPPIQVPLVVPTSAPDLRLTIWPNPAPAGVRFLTDLPAGPGAVLAVYDLRGRRLFRTPVAPGRIVTDWPGTDAGGAPLPSGVYFVRLEGIRTPVLHKVVLLR